MRRARTSSSLEIDSTRCSEGAKCVQRSAGTSRVSRRCCIWASIAAGSLILGRCTGFHAHIDTRVAHGATCSRQRRLAYGYRHRGSVCPRATCAPEQQASSAVLVAEEDAGDTSAVLDDLAKQDIDAWDGHEYGFDWYLEKARRGMSGKGGFSPLRMTFWRPVEGKVEELSPWDSVYIILRNLAQMMGMPSLDNAPLAKIEAYTGSWLTFLQKVSNGRLEDLAGGPLFLMLEKYFLEEGVSLFAWSVVETATGFVVLWTLCVAERLRREISFAITPSEYQTACYVVVIYLEGFCGGCSKPSTLAAISVRYRVYAVSTVVDLQRDFSPFFGIMKYVRRGSLSKQAVQG